MMILRPVSPASPMGPPISNRPVGFTSSRYPDVSICRFFRTGATTRAWISGVSSSFRSMSGACWADTTTVSSRTGSWPTYSIVTWVLPSGRRYGTSPLRLSSDRRRASGAAVGQVAGGPAQGRAGGEPVREHDRQRHQLGGFPARETEHDALVTRALPVQFAGALALTVLEGVLHALGDVRGLGADRDGHATGRTVVTLYRGVVSDLQDLLPDDARDVHVGFCAHLTGHMDLAGGDQRLHGHVAVRIILDHRVENGITYLIRHLVRMTLRHRLGGKETSGHRTPISAALRLRRSVAGLADRPGRNPPGGETRRAKPSRGRNPPGGETLPGA